MEITVEILLALFFVATAAGFIDAMAGGGGLITLPALLAAGLSPTQALATNKLQSSFGSFSASWYFVRNGIVSLKEMRFAILCTFIGAAIGAEAVQPRDIGRWALLGLVAAFIVGTYAMAANATLFRNRRIAPVPVWLAIAFHLGVGLIFGVVVVVGGCFRVVRVAAAIRPAVPTADITAPPTENRATFRKFRRCTGSLYDFLRESS